MKQYKNPFRYTVDTSELLEFDIDRMLDEFDEEDDDNNKIPTIVITPFFDIATNIDTLLELSIAFDTNRFDALILEAQTYPKITGNDLFLILSTFFKHYKSLPENFRILYYRQFVAFQKTTIQDEITNFLVNTLSTLNTEEDIKTNIGPNYSEPEMIKWLIVAEFHPDNNMKDMAQNEIERIGSEVLTNFAATHLHSDGRLRRRKRSKTQYRKSKNKLKKKSNRKKSKKHSRKRRL